VEAVARRHLQQVMTDDVVVDIVLVNLYRALKGAALLDKTSGSVGGFGNRVNDFDEVVRICD